MNSKPKRKEEEDSGGLRPVERKTDVRMGKNQDAPALISSSPALRKKVESRVNVTDACGVDEILEGKE